MSRWWSILIIILYALIGWFLPTITKVLPSKSVYVGLVGAVAMGLGAFLWAVWFSPAMNTSVTPTK